MLHWFFLICIFLITSNVCTIFHVLICHPSICLLGWSIVQIFCPFFLYWSVSFLIIEYSCNLDMSFIRYTFCKYFLLIKGLSFHFPDSIIFNSDQGKFIFFFQNVLCIWCCIWEIFAFDYFKNWFSHQARENVLSSFFKCFHIT